jgi:tetratricopeptide (TPR) repeat protein
VPVGPGGDTSTTVQHVRLFPNLPGLAWEFRVHEQILPALRRRGVPVRFAGVTVQHTGYQDPALQEGKRLRNLRLLEMELAEQPDHPYTLFNLGCTYQDMSRPAEALPFFERSLRLSDPTDSIVRKLYALIAQCQRQLGRRPEALAACREGRRHYPEDVELHFQEGMAHREGGNRAGAEAFWLRCLDGAEQPHFESVHVGIRGYLTRNNLGHLYAEQGRHAEAEAQWRAAVAEKPDALPSWAALGRLYLRRERWPDFDAVVARLAGEPWGQTEATTLRARRLAAAGDLAAARLLLEEDAQRRPNEVGLWAMLSEVVLRLGTDPSAAAVALRRVIELDPTDAQARAALEDVLRRRGGQAA